MALKRCFVQFPHPGVEHTPTSGRDWNKRENGDRINAHRRKFMQLDGEWIDDGDARHSGKLWAWGEWEPESKRVRDFSPQDGDPHAPRYLWEPYYVPRCNYADVHNTDPFIFGDRFLYSNCRQPNSVGLRHLERGSVIAFGSGKTVDGKRKWVLDTVLVVHDSVEYDMRKARVELKDWASDTFLDVTGGPLSDHPDTIAASGRCAPTSTRLRLYRGATPDNSVDGMFSFFPAIPGESGRGFPRPVIDLPPEYFSPANWQAAKGSLEELTPHKLRCLWSSIVKQVREAGLVRGTSAALPKRRRD